MSRQPYRKLTPKKRARFLQVLAQTCNVTKAAEAIKVSRVALYELRQRSETFRKEWAKAEQLGVQALEDELVRRAADGYDEPVFYQGEQCGMVRKFSDTLLIFKLKGERPEKYREHVSAEISGPGGGPVATVGITTNDPVEAGREYLRMIHGGK